jgi:hypothetical protein
MALPPMPSIEPTKEVPAELPELPDLTAERLAAQWMPLRFVEE